MRPSVVGGAVAIVVAALAALRAPDGGSGSAVAVFVAVLSVLGIVGALWKVLGPPAVDSPSVAAPPWSDDGALFERAPERTPGNDVLSGESFAAVLDEAADTARVEGTVEAGFETVRPVLRRALVDALSLGRESRSVVEQRLEAGTWTDDRAAAAVVDPGVPRPEWSLRMRIEAWLFPERVVRRQLQRAVQAIAEAADDAVPDVPGQNAPRNVPVLQPPLERLQRGVDGRVQHAIDPLATARGPRPPGGDGPSVDIDDEADTPEAGATDGQEGGSR
ncbi:hypothetical protein BRC91_06310 [Halobacteriales archaeon QS_4_62_28]|nr:MAG: hypothetical protein BRC91_06310 [Halobacteriales archaeon QS_4_62_28]